MNTDRHEWNFEKLVEVIRHAHEELAAQTGRSVNLSLTIRNWLIEFYIAEYEQHGADRAEYGARLLESSSTKLAESGMEGVAARSLRQYRQFYLTYPQIWQTSSAKTLEHLMPATIWQTLPAGSHTSAGITREFVGQRPIIAELDPYNPTSSTRHVNFNTSKTNRWETDARRCHINWVILDSDWEAEFCRVAETHPRVHAHVKNHNLGLEGPYRYGSEMRRYIPDFIVAIDDGHGKNDLVHLIVEIKGYRREDAKNKKSTMEIYWVPGVNHLGTHGRWAFAEFTDLYEIDADFKNKVEQNSDKMIESATVQAASTEK